jgi:hypothetical protein
MFRSVKQLLEFSVVFQFVFFNQILSERILVNVFDLLWIATPNFPCTVRRIVVQGHVQRGTLHTLLKGGHNILYAEGDA